MYQLIRADNELRLVAQKGNKDDKPIAAGGIAPLTGHQLGPSKNIPDPQTWRDFVMTGKVRPDLVASHILESWNRCHDADVEFAGGACRDILSAGELSKRESSLLEISTPVMDALAHWLNDHPFVVVLVDHDSYILNTVGDVGALKQAERLNFGPGANWSEGSVGTNAIGVAMAVGNPVQVTGREHYNDGHHNWTCAASPILAPDGIPVGCLDISGPMENASPKLLGMVKAASLFIAERIGLEQGWRELINRQKKLSAAMDMLDEPVLSLDRKGHILEANLSAARLLGRPREHLLGRPHHAFLSLGNALASAREDGQSVQGLTAIHTNSGNVPRQFTCRTHRGNGGGVEGFLLTLSSPSPQRVRTRTTRGEPLRYSFADIVGKSPELIKVVEQAKSTARGDSTVLLLGESGVGKEMFAQSIHRAGPRSDGPFVVVNCGAFAPELVQSELFGYADGAFTGAQKGGQKGKLEQAGGGTLFLDEVAEMPLDMQVNLLRFLENRTYCRVGGGRTREADVRIIAATNRDLKALVDRGGFRRDLYYRLNVVVMEIPALRRRGRDIPLLAQHFLPGLAARHGKSISGLTRQARKALVSHDWPGNIRELHNILERAVNFAAGKRIGLKDLPAELQSAGDSAKGKTRDKLLPLAALEKRAIEDALLVCRGNVSQAAQALGIGRNTLYEKTRRYGISLAGKRKGSANKDCSKSVHL